MYKLDFFGLICRWFSLEAAALCHDFIAVPSVVAALSFVDATVHWATGSSKTICSVFNLESASATAFCFSRCQN